MAGPLRLYHPPPSSLMAVGSWNVGKKVLFFLNGPALYPPPPLLMARPLCIKRRTFIAASLKNDAHNFFFY